MPKPYSLDLRERVVSYVEAGHSRRAAAGHFRVSASHLRAMAMRTIDELWNAIGQICDLFTPQECANYFQAAGYGFT